MESYTFTILCGVALYVTIFILVLQQRLERQQEENEMERKRLEDLVNRLESQIREQTRMLDEVWSV